MVLVGIFIHIFLLLSIFDIYFKSPIVEDVAHYQPHHEALADRLVLFSVDGLRAESFLNFSTMRYLRSIANSHGRWGISQARVPTESRPGHVAIISGFYEDPSTVAKGWKENPVDFDSVFNQTTYTWCWGTYDIVHIFTKGNTGDHIFAKTFDPYSHTFSTNGKPTDAWVFKSVWVFFKTAPQNVDLSEKLKTNRIAFFLHLLATDTSGHRDKPGTKKFRKTIRFVDRRIKKMERVIRHFYGDDGRTTFLMTSDHGMTDWGSHGAGDDHETQTPYVIWGAGVKQVRGNQTDPSTKGMSLERRLDMEQADLAPLMSTILSIPVPVNSVGRLAPGVLNMTLSNKAKALYSNAKQLALQYDKKRSNVEANIIAVLHFPYKPFSKKKFEEKNRLAEKLLEQQQFEKLILLCEEIMSLSLSGLQYYHNYYQTTLLIVVTLSFVGWILCLLKMLAQQNTDEQRDAFSFIKDCKRYNLGLSVTFSVLFCGSFYFVLAQSLPMAYYIYFLSPIGLWWYALSDTDICRESFQKIRNRGTVTVLIEVVCYTLGSIALGLSFTYRWMLSIPLLGMGLWPFFSTKRQCLSIPNLIFWSTTVAGLSVFTFIPVVGKKVFIELVIAAGLLQLILLPVYMTKVVLPLYKKKLLPKREILLSIAQLVLRVVCLYNIYVQSKRFERGTAVSRVDQGIAWLIAALSLLLPLDHSRRLLCRLFAINSAILNVYLLLSVAHEGLFLVLLMCNTSIWIYIEVRMRQDVAQKPILELMLEEGNQEETSMSLANIERNITSEDFRRAFFFTTYIVTAFFGTGNIASLNSFEVRWVTCFLTSYKPFLITGLILLKTLVPFLAVACNFRAVQILTKAPIGYLNIIVLIYSNIVGIQLLYCVRNTGTWLDIGTSISQYVIVQVITIFIVLINKLAKYLVD